MVGTSMASIAPKTIMLCLLLPLATMADDKNSVYAEEDVYEGDNEFHRILGSDPQQKPKFKPGTWMHAHATFYLGDSKTYGGACGYKDTVGQGYGQDTAALSHALFNDGQKCGACFEVKCRDDKQWCKSGQPSILITATDNCPPNYDLPNDDGGWCNPPLKHFDLTKHAFLKIAHYKAGIVPVKYRRVSCNKQGGIRFTMRGNPYYYEIWVSNVGGAGDLVTVLVKGHDNLKWTTLKRSWGQVWVTGDKLLGESLTFRVRAGDGRYTTAWNIAPKDWSFGQTFEGKNFY